MVASQPVRRFEMYLLSLDPTKGSEIKKMGPCLISSNAEEKVLNVLQEMFAP